MFFGDWSNLDDLIYNFKIDESAVENLNILYAYYSYECYEGSAFIIFEKDGKLYEVHGSHCSCHGLEDQWEPEETSIDALRKQFSNLSDYSSDKEIWKELEPILNTYEEEKKA